jgi:hypothetical protein
MKNKTIIKNGVEYVIMEIAGQMMEIRVANKKDVEDFKNNKSTYSHPA